METRKKFLITLGIGVVLVISFFLITEAITKLTGYSISDDEEKDGFEKCLEEQDITLYIRSDDFVKILNDVELKDYLEDFEIFNCLRNNQVCSGKGISSFPYTWVINEKKFEKDISLRELVESSGCNLFEE